jgi:hypothetical protein
MESPHLDRNGDIHTSVGRVERARGLRLEDGMGTGTYIESFPGSCVRGVARWTVHVVGFWGGRGGEVGGDVVRRWRRWEGGVRGGDLMRRMMRITPWVVVGGLVLL